MICFREQTTSHRTGKSIHCIVSASVEKKVGHRVMTYTCILGKTYKTLTETFTESIVLIYTFDRNDQFCISAAFSLYAQALWIQFLYYHCAFQQFPFHRPLQSSFISHTFPTPAYPGKNLNTIRITAPLFFQIQIISGNKPLSVVIYRFIIQFLPPPSATFTKNVFLLIFHLAEFFCISVKHHF